MKVTAVVTPAKAGVHRGKLDSRFRGLSPCLLESYGRQAEGFRPQGGNDLQQREQRLCRPALPKACEGVKKSKQLSQSRKGAKKRKGEVLSLLCGLCVLCAFA